MNIIQYGTLSTMIENIKTLEEFTKLKNTIDSLKDDDAMKYDLSKLLAQKFRQLQASNVK